MAVGLNIQTTVYGNVSTVAAIHWSRFACDFISHTLIRDTVCTVGARTRELTVFSTELIQEKFLILNSF